MQCFISFVTREKWTQVHIRIIIRIYKYSENDDLRSIDFFGRVFRII